LRYNEETEVSVMERIPRGVYTRELPEEAVKLVVEGGESNPEVGRRLSIAASVPHESLHEAERGSLRQCSHGEFLGHAQE